MPDQSFTNNTWGKILFLLLAAHINVPYLECQISKKKKSQKRDVFFFLFCFFRTHIFAPQFFWVRWFSFKFSSIFLSCLLRECKLDLDCKVKAFSDCAVSREQKKKNQCETYQGGIRVRVMQKCWEVMQELETTEVILKVRLCQVEIFMSPFCFASLI